MSKFEELLLDLIWKGFGDNLEIEIELEGDCETIAILIHHADDESLVRINKRTLEHEWLKRRHCSKPWVKKERLNQRQRWTIFYIKQLIKESKGEDYNG